MIIINTQLLAVILFVITYILMLTIPKYKSYIALGTALIFIIIGILPIDKVYKRNRLSNHNFTN